MWQSTRGVSYSKTRALSSLISKSSLARGGWVQSLPFALGTMTKDRKRNITTTRVQARTLNSRVWLLTASRQSDSHGRAGVDVDGALGTALESHGFDRDTESAQALLRLSC